MRGLDPRIHHLCKISAKKMDPRVKPAGDGIGLMSADANRPGTALEPMALIFFGGRAGRAMKRPRKAGLRREGALSDCCQFRHRIL
jgi:hypothetical protein